MYFSVSLGWPLKCTSISLSDTHPVTSGAGGREERSCLGNWYKEGRKRGDGIVVMAETQLTGPPAKT